MWLLDRRTGGLGPSVSTVRGASSSLFTLDEFSEADSPDRLSLFCEEESVDNQRRSFEQLVVRRSKQSIEIPDLFFTAEAGVQTESVSVYQILYFSYLVFKQFYLHIAIYAIM